MSSFVRGGPQCDYSSTQQPDIICALKTGELSKEYRWNKYIFKQRPKCSENVCLQYLSFSKAVSKVRLKTPFNLATFKLNLEILKWNRKIRKTPAGFRNHYSISQKKKIRKRVSYVENNLIYVIYIIITIITSFSFILNVCLYCIW